MAKNTEMRNIVESIDTRDEAHTALMAQLEALKAEGERLRAENASLKAMSQKRISLKVSEKGAVSMYGMGRWPVTLYREQWERVYSNEVSAAVKAFISVNADKLSSKEAFEARKTASTHAYEAGKEMSPDAIDETL